MIPDDLRFAKTHEWIRVDSAGGQSVATLGISHVAVEALTDLVYIELPEVGRQVAAGQSCGEIESVKAVSDIYSPVSGEITQVNAELPGKLQLLSEDPYGAGWIAKIRLTQPTEVAGLLDRAAYERMCAEEAH